MSPPFCEVASPPTALLKAQALESQAAPCPTLFSGLKLHLLLMSAQAPWTVSPRSQSGPDPLNLSTGWPPPDLPPSLCRKPHRFPAAFPQPWGQWVLVLHPEQPRGLRRLEDRGQGSSGHWDPLQGHSLPCRLWCQAHGPPWRGLRPKPWRGWRHWQAGRIGPHHRGQSPLNATGWKIASTGVL